MEMKGDTMMFLQFLLQLLLIFSPSSDASLDAGNASLNLLSNLVHTPALIGDPLKLEIDLRPPSMKSISLEIIITSYSFSNNLQINDGPFHLCEVSLLSPRQLTFYQYPILNFTSGKVQTIHIIIPELNAKKNSQIQFVLDAVLGDPFPPRNEKFSVYFGVFIFGGNQKHSLFLRKSLELQGDVSNVVEPVVALELDVESMSISLGYSYILTGNISVESSGGALQVSSFVKNGFDGAVQLFGIDLELISGKDTCNYLNEDFGQVTKSWSSMKGEGTSGVGRRIYFCADGGWKSRNFKFRVGLSLTEGLSFSISDFKVGMVLSNRMSILVEKNVLFTVVASRRRRSFSLRRINSNLYDSTQLLGFTKICNGSTIALRIHFHLPPQSFHNLTVIAFKSSSSEPFNIIMRSSSLFKKVQNVSSAYQGSIQKMFYMENHDSHKAYMSLDVLYFINSAQIVIDYVIKYEFDGVRKKSIIPAEKNCVQEDFFSFPYKGKPEMTYMHKDDQGVLLFEHCFPPRAISRDDYSITVNSPGTSSTEFRFKEIRLIGGDCKRFLEESSQFTSANGPGNASLILPVGRACPLYNQFTPTKVLFRITYRLEKVDKFTLYEAFYAHVKYNGNEHSHRVSTTISTNANSIVSCDSRPSSSPFLRALAQDTIKTDTFMVKYLVRPAMCTYGNYKLILKVTDPKICICTARLHRLGADLMMKSIEIPGFELGLHGESCFSNATIEIKKLFRIAYVGFDNLNFLTDSSTLSISVSIKSKEAVKPITIEASLETDTTTSAKNLTSRFDIGTKDPSKPFTATGNVSKDSGTIHPFEIKILDIELEVINSADFFIVLKQNKPSQLHLLHAEIGQKGDNIPCVSLNINCAGSSHHSGSGYDACDEYRVKISTCYAKYSGYAKDDRLTLKLYLTLTEPEDSSSGINIPLFIIINEVTSHTKLTKVVNASFCEVKNGVIIEAKESNDSIIELESGVLSNVSLLVKLSQRIHCSLQVCVQGSLMFKVPGIDLDGLYLPSDENPRVLAPSLTRTQITLLPGKTCSQPNKLCLKLGKLLFLQLYNDSPPDTITIRVKLRINDANRNIDQYVDSMKVYVGRYISKKINIRVRRSADYYAQLQMSISLNTPMETVGPGEKLKITLNLRMDPKSRNDIRPISIKMNASPLIKEILSMDSNCSTFTQKSLNERNLWLLTFSGTLLFTEIIQLNLTLKVDDFEIGRKRFGQIIFTPICGVNHKFYIRVPGRTCGRVSSVLFNYKSKDPSNLKINMSDTCARVSGITSLGRQSFNWSVNHTEITFYQKHCLYDHAYIDFDFRITALLRKLTFKIIEGKGSIEILQGNNSRFLSKEYASTLTKGSKEITLTYSVRFVRLLFKNIESKLSLKGLQWYGYIENSSNLESCLWDKDERRPSPLDYRAWAVDTKQNIVYFCYRPPVKPGLRCLSYNVDKKIRIEFPSYIKALLGIQKSKVYFEDERGQRFFSSDGIHIVFTSNAAPSDLKMIDISSRSQVYTWAGSDYKADVNGISKSGRILLQWANTCSN